MPQGPISEFFAITLTLFLIIDALGNIPTYLYLLKPYSAKDQKKIAIRELIIALAIMVLFHFVGQILLTLLNVTSSTVKISSGIILFIIAIRLIFSHEEDKPRWKEQGLFIVPIATPIIAGPSLLSVIMIFSQDKDMSDPLVLGSIFTAWLFSSLIFLFARPIYRLIKEKGLLACQRLTGLIIALIAVQNFILGVQEFI